MRDDDDEDDYDEPDPPPRIPGIVRAAGIIWLVYGTLSLFGTILSFVMQAGQAAGGGARNPTSPCCGIAIGVAFAYCGLQTVKGDAKDTLGNSIGSLLLGLLQILVAIGLAVLANGFLGGNLQIDPVFIYIAVAMTGFFGTMLILAGTLGLMGRSAYREWREFAHPKKNRKRRRPREDEEDEED